MSVPVSEAVRSALASLMANRLRSFLTTLGIVIGTASVIAVVSLVQGMSDSVKNQFSEMGGNTLSLHAINDTENYRTGKINFITIRDIDVLRYRVEGIAQVAPLLELSSAQVSYKGRTRSPEVYGTTSDLQAVRGRYTEQGRFLVRADDVARRKVAAVGTKLRDELKLPKDPLGEYIQINRDWFKVVGIMEPRGEILGFSQDNYVAIPFDVARSLIGETATPIISASFTAPMNQVDDVRERVTKALRVIRRMEPGQEDTFKVEAADSFIEQFKQISTTIAFVVAGVVGISLVVGGIGIMNMMLVSVTERTREIGVLKALGATRRDIMLQFLLEAGLLALFGGILGVCLGYLVGIGVSAVIPGFPEASAPAWVVLLAAGFSAAVGVGFGIMPASKAARLDPVESLRYE